MSRYVFDLDNTLIETDELNNLSYNHALSLVGVSPITGFGLITREIVFGTHTELTDFQKERIVQLKQDYFINNINFTNPNTSLIDLLQSNSKEHCILWTSADTKRVKGLLEYYGLKHNFISIIYSNKKQVNEDVEKICSIFCCDSSQLLFFEDDTNVIKALKLLGYNVKTALFC